MANEVALPRVDPPRVDIRDKVSGGAQYLDDLPDLPGTVYAAALRSPYSHAKIVSIDSSRAERLDGVLAVLDREHLDEYDVHFEQGGVNNYFITTDRARFDGDLLAMVVATDLRTARCAVELIDVDYDLRPTLFTVNEALAPGAPRIHEQLADNQALADTLEWGDVEAALGSADHVFEGTFSCPAIYHHPMEAPMSTIASVTREGVEFWAPTNHPFDIAHDAAKLFDLAPERVRVHGPHVGGNFGAKHMSAEILATAALSLRVGRPVKFVPTDEEGFRVTSRHAMDFTARIGVAADGMLVALDVELDINTGAYFTGAAIATGNAVTSCWGAYRVPNFRVRARTAYTNRVPAGTFRNTGKNQTTFALDCAMDSLARQMGVNPTELRRKNFVRRGETQATASWSRNGKVAAPQIPPLDTDLSDLVDHALRAIGWDGRPNKTGRQGDGETGRELAPESLSPSPSRPVSPSPRLARGRGLAVSLRRGANIGDATAMAAIDRDGVVTISHNAPDVGEGAHTVISVVAARSLGVPQSQVRVGMPDTANQLFFAGTSSQRTTVQMGNAVRNACEHLKIELARTAAESYGGSPEDWRVADGELRRGEERYSLADLMKSLPDGVVLQGVGSYEHATVEDPQFGGHDYWAPGVAAVELEVDRETGEIHILQYAAVADAGTIMHYRSAKAQIEGGAVMGFGAALSEQIVYEEGQLLNADAFQYRLPLMSDVPENFQVVLLENGDGPGPFGAKGVAQVSIPCVAPAVCNAIYDAVGVRLTSIPFTPESILRALGTLE